MRYRKILNIKSEVTLILCKVFFYALIHLYGEFFSFFFFFLVGGGAYE